MIMSRIFCIIPAYNEEGNILEVINSLKKYQFNIVVVDDGSSDNTTKTTIRTGVKVIKHLINRGQGAALQTGNEYALSKKAEIIFHFDGDGQFCAEEVKDIIEPIKNGTADIVFGSRFLSKRSQIPFLKNHFILPLAKLFNYLFYGFILTDPQCGFRAMSNSAAKTMVIEQDGMAHCSEIMAKAFDNKLRIKEVPVTVLYQRYGQKLSGGLKIIKDIIIKRIIK